MHIQFNKIAAALAVTMGAGVGFPALAQHAPDAGQLIDELRQPSKPLPAPAKLTIERPQTSAGVQTGGPQVTIHAVRLNGMQSFDEESLLATLGDYQGRSYDLAGLWMLAERITRHYREHDFPFALAYLPPQQVDHGEVGIEIIEGRYGAVRVLGNDALTRGVAGFTIALREGEAIQGVPLERTIHLLGELPGITIDAALMPGSAEGTGDLEIRIAEGKRLAGELGLDNHGNRHTGAWRTSALLGVNRVLTVGDQLTAGALISDEQFVQGQFTYALPLGHSGLRSRIAYSRGDYELGGDFASLGASGTAGVGTLGLDYPLLRSSLANLDFQTAYRHKSLQDQPADGGATLKKSSQSLSMGLRFDRRDTFAGGGVSWGTLEWTSGRLSLDASLRSSDSTTARSEGRFSKANVELARQQALPGAFTLFGHLAGQWTDDNLDSSEGFGLGGTNGVRAYPQGEAFGDRGWLMQIELRHRMAMAGRMEPFVFYDLGTISINARPWAAGENIQRLSGAGLGIRATMDNWSFEALAAWRLSDTPLSDTQGDHPRVWAGLRYSF